MDRLLTCGVRCAGIVAALLAFAIVLRAADVAAPGAKAEPGRAKAVNTEKSEGEAETTRHDKVYSFQHRVLPMLTHKVGRPFYDDVAAGNVDKLRSIAEEVVDVAFAKALSVRPLKDSAGVLIEFEKPNEATECFFALIALEGDTLRCLTCEKAEDIMRTGIKVCVGEWSAKGGHLNYGFLKEETEAAFLRAATAKLGPRK